MAQPESATRCGDFRLEALPMPSLADVRDLLRARRPQAAPYVVAITGSVAAGKSVFAGELAADMAAWPEHPSVEVVCTDGFLMDNAALDARGLTQRKGFPESYDAEAMRAALAAIREGPARFPAYSHVTYDVDPDLARTLQPPDVLIVEGLGLQGDRGGLIDALIYLDADEADLEAWFTERFIGLWAAAEHDPASFYARFRNLDEAGARGFARMIWQAINLPNLRNHIVQARDLADIVIRKGPGHAIEAIGGRWANASAQ
jgi:type I pantothenate kinase